MILKKIKEIIKSSEKLTQKNLLDYLFNLLKDSVLNYENEIYFSDLAEQDVDRENVEFLNSYSDTTIFDEYENNKEFLLKNIDWSQYKNSPLLNFDLSLLHFEKIELEEFFEVYHLKDKKQIKVIYFS